MSSIFPMGLNTMSGQDPFSRTVSPIGHRFKIGHGGSGLTNSMGMGMDVDQDIGIGIGMGSGMNGDINMENDRDPQMLNSGDVTMAPTLSVVDFAYHNPNANNLNTFHSAPTSPRGTRMDLEVNQDRDRDRAASAEPPSSSFFGPALILASASGIQANPFLLDQTHTQNQAQDQDHDMIMGKSRKSSLLTLLHSRPNTPISTPFIPNPIIQQAPQGGSSGNESPTLFNGPNEPDHDPLPFINDGTGGRRISFWNSMSMGMGMPNAGGVGRLSLSKGSEGLGLGLGLEHTHGHVN
jgi:hypothetical protein